MLKQDLMTIDLDEEKICWQHLENCCRGNLKVTFLAFGHFSTFSLNQSIPDEQECSHCQQTRWSISSSYAAEWKLNEGHDRHWLDMLLLVYLELSQIAKEQDSPWPVWLGWIWPPGFCMICLINRQHHSQHVEITGVIKLHMFWAQPSCCHWEQWMADQTLRLEWHNCLCYTHSHTCLQGRKENRLLYVRHRAEKTWSKCASLQHDAVTVLGFRNWTTLTCSAPIRK